MPVIQQERGVKAVKGLPTRWGVRAYRELRVAQAGTVGGVMPPRYTALAALLDEVTNAPMPLDATDAQLVMLAQRYANDCGNVGVVHNLTEPKALRERMASICRTRGVKPPQVDDDVQAIKRCTDPAWWRRNLRKVHGRAFEAAAIRLGFVSVRAGAYASNETVTRRLSQVARNKAALASVKMVNEHGAEYGLDQLAAKGTSNKRIRRGELMLRLAGCEAVANEAKHAGVFITLTAPSKYHAVLAKSGTVNPHYNDSTPRDVQAYLQKTWARTRTAYGRHNIKPYGFRIAEPHHDGCVHWHALLFMPADQVETFCDIVKTYALAEDGDEPGARANRVKFEHIDSSKGSAAAYIAKYISKNIDDDDDASHDEFTDAEGNPVQLAIDNNSVRKASQRVDAWAGVWGIRQFQPIGQPPVTVWREMRRVEEDKVANAPQRIREAWEACQRVYSTDEDGVVTVERPADFGRYIRAQGGVCLGRDYAIAIKEDQVAIDGRYGQELGWAPVGVFLKCVPESVYQSTRHTWTRKQAGGGLCPSWSPVNKCTAPGWTAHAPDCGPVAQFDEEWFDSDEYRAFVKAPDVAGAEWFEAEAAAAANYPDDVEVLRAQHAQRLEKLTPMRVVWRRQAQSTGGEKCGDS